MHPEPCSERDPGLQIERTVLAWRRTGLAAAVAAFVATREIVVTVGWLALLPCLICLAGALAIASRGGWRYLAASHAWATHSSIAPTNLVMLPVALGLATVSVLVLALAAWTLVVSWP